MLYWHLGHLTSINNLPFAFVSAVSGKGLSKAKFAGLAHLGHMSSTKSSLPKKVPNLELEIHFPNKVNPSLSPYLLTTH